jgi:D-xylose transport system substrate-binding protein
MTSGSRRIAALGVVLTLLAMGCASTQATASVGDRGPTGIVGLLLPNKQTTRYETDDTPIFEAELSKVCPNATVDEQNAESSGPMQQLQVEEEIARGARVLVLDPQDGSALGSVVSDASARSVKVISYDRLVTAPGSKPDAYVAYDAEQAGALQGKSLLARLAAAPRSPARVIWISGPAADPSSTLIQRGARSVLAGKVEIVDQAAMTDRGPKAGQAVMAASIARVGPDGYDGVYAATDGGASGAVAAERAVGIDPLGRPLTGGGAELDAIQRIVAGSQSMTVYQPVRPEAVQAADLACAALGGKLPAAHATTSNGTVDVPSYLLNPIGVSLDGRLAGTVSIEDSVVKDRLFGADTVARICAADLAARCAAAGIK